MNDFTFSSSHMTFHSGMHSRPAETYVERSLNFNMENGKKMPSASIILHSEEKSNDAK